MNSYRFFRSGKKKKRTKQTLVRHIIRDILLLAVSVCFFVVGGVSLWAANLEIPDFNSLETRKVTQSTKIYDRTGTVLLYEIHDDIKRTLVTFDEMSPYIRYATVAIEDSEFYRHHGVRPLSFLRAAFINLSTGSYSQGGSTITQQLVKNTLLNPEKKVSRKLKEWIIALKIERVFSKQDILTLYLNEAPYGGNIYGVEEASRTFFGKQSKDLTIAEAAYLAALPQAPTYYSPFGNHRDKLDARQQLVLQKMHDLGYITDREYEMARNEKVTFVTDTNKGILAPHFVIWVREQLVKEFGDEAVRENGYRVITTLDYNLQKQAEEIVKEYAAENEVKFNAHNAGMVGIDPKTGDVLVMVGSRDYFDKKHEGNFNVTLARRQPGSAFKPFVYATAFTKGYTPDTVVFDLKTQFQTTCGPDGKPIDSNTDPNECYTPKNYDHKYRGPITLRDALAQSVNVPAIKTLYLAGLKDSLRTAQSMGISSLQDVSRYGLTLVLGGGEVTLLEMTGAYGVFANDGMRTPPRGILRIEDSQGKLIKDYSATNNTFRAIPENTARLINSVLSDNKARTPAFGSHSYLYFPDREVAVKTGTTNDYKDAWIIGYTPSFSLGAWVGNNDNSPMEKKVAGFIVAPMWHEMMKRYLASSSPERFPAPKPYPSNLKPVLRGEWRGNKTYTIDRISGKLATKYTPPQLREERIIPDIHNILHWVKKNDPTGPVPKNPSLDPQYNLWEIPVLKWVAQTNATSTIPTPPTEYDDIHTKETIPKVRISGLSSQQQYPADATISLTVETQSTYPIQKAELYINNHFVTDDNSAPFNFSIIPSQDIDAIQTINNIKIVAIDTMLNSGSSTAVLQIQTD